MTKALESWTRWHAALLLGAFGVAAFLGKAWPVAAAGAASLAVLAGVARGAWILVTGVLRYVYVLVRATIPARRPDVPRSRFGRLAFTSLALGLFVAFALPGRLGALGALAGTALVTFSFARSFYDSYAPGNA